MNTQELAIQSVDDNEKHAQYIEQKREMIRQICAKDVPDLNFNIFIEMFQEVKVARLRAPANIVVKHPTNGVAKTAYGGTCGLKKTLRLQQKQRFTKRTASLLYL